MAIEQFPRTVCIEAGGLASLQDDPAAISLFEAEAALPGATIHWGQINNRTVADTDRTYRHIGPALKEICTGHSTRTFNNDFCLQRGLEPS